MNKLIKRREIPVGEAVSEAPLLDRLYRARYIKNSQELDRTLKCMLNPNKLHGIERAVELLLEAYRQQQKIIIVGDFDADGATSTALTCRDTLLADFEQKWQHDGLVMDKWFALQATRPDENVLEVVNRLMDHPSFNFNNPNRLRALVGSFVNRNLKAFHKIGGSGYRFLTDILIKLNDSNPQVAARLIEPLIHFARYDAQRQTLMKRALERLSTVENLSKDLFEKIEKALQ